MTQWNPALRTNLTEHFTLTTSDALFDAAKKYIPGGVNSPVRAFKSVGGTPLFINRAEGAYLYDSPATHIRRLLMLFCRLCNPA